MHMKLGGAVLTQGELEQILNQALDILADTGVTVENKPLLERLSDAGGRADFSQLRVRFSRDWLASFLQQSEKVSWEGREVSFPSAAEIYQGRYLDPRDGAYRPWTRERLLEYLTVARSLPNIDRVTLLGYPAEEAPARLQPLNEKLFCWKYGLEGGTAVWETGLCPRIHEMFLAYASELGTPVAQVFNCGVFLISPLKFAAAEAEQYLYFTQRGLPVTVGALGSLGGTAPVTAAGALALHLAENLFINILDRVFGGKRTLSFFNSLSVLDMSSGSFQYGRPEQIVLNIAGAQLAKYLGGTYAGHGGLSDAKQPGHESAAQKLTSAIFNAVTGGTGHVAAGLLGVDEIFSPVQMILDDQLLGSLRRLTRGVVVNRDTLAMETIREVGPGGNFLDTDHTAESFREALWWPTLWSTGMFHSWDRGDRKTDLDLARDKFFSILEHASPPEARISPELERELLRIIGT